VKIFKSDNAEVVKVIEEHTDCVMSAFFDDQMKYIITASLDKRAILFNMKDFTIIKEIPFMGKVLFADFD